MLFSTGHGKSVFTEKTARSGPHPAAEVFSASSFKTENSQSQTGEFQYYFPESQPLPYGSDTMHLLDKLANGMIEDTGSPKKANSSIPPIFTYLGQFIDHDITAGTDRDADISIIATDDPVPLERDRVVLGISNLRAGSLRLDSVYGNATTSGAFEQKLARLLRHPKFPSKMRVALFSKSGLGSVPLPRDGAGDLLRLGRLLKDQPPPLTVEELASLPANLRDVFLDKSGNPKIHKAVIGDGRNDENLFVAQIHLAFLRLHNRIVDSCDDKSVLSQGDDAVYTWAKQQVIWIYQWLVVHEFLPTICHRKTFETLLAREAPLYSQFIAQHPPKNGSFLPLPLEFSVSAFRYGHSMVRADYDWNRFFGRTVGSSVNLLDRAPFALMFAFTGNGDNPMPTPDGGSFDRLPSHWGVEWERLIDADAVDGDRFARSIDSELSPPLSMMQNEPEGHDDLFRMLARRNLRRGHRLNIPSAQDCIAGIYLKTDLSIEPLTPEELTTGKTRDAVIAGRFDQSTPLWFYILKEAEIKADGQTLGPLGTAIVGDTLLGLIKSDPDSYWHQPGSDRGRWHPRDAAKPAGAAITSIREMLKAALLL